MLQSRMMDFPLTLTHFLRRASALFGSTEIVTWPVLLVLVSLTVPLLPE